MKNMLIKHEGMWNLKLGNMIGEVVHELTIHILHGMDEGSLTHKAWLGIIY
jgi:hypothetical protein